jgi:hypothetical protein
MFFPWSHSRPPLSCPLLRLSNNRNNRLNVNTSLWSCTCIENLTIIEHNDNLPCCMCYSIATPRQILDVNALRDAERNAQVVQANADRETDIAQVEVVTAERDLPDPKPAPPKPNATSPLPNGSPPLPDATPGLSPSMVPSTSPLPNATQLLPDAIPPLRNGTLPMLPVDSKLWQSTSQMDG